MAISTENFKAYDPLIILGISVLCVLTALLVSLAPFKLSIGIALGIVVFMIVLVNLKIGLFLIVFSMLLSPELTVYEGGGGKLEASKAVSVRLEDLILLLICAVWLVKTSVFEHVKLGYKTGINRYIFIYMVIVFISTFFGVMAEKVGFKAGFFFTVKYLEYFVLFFMTVNIIKTTGDREYVEKIINAMFITAFIVCLYAMATMGTGERASAPFEGERGEPNTLGMYLIIIGALAYGLIYNKVGVIQEHRLWVLIVILFIPFLATLSRVSYLALIPTILMFGFLSKHKQWFILVTGLLIFILPLTIPLIKWQIQEIYSQEVKRMSKDMDQQMGSSATARIEKFFDDLKNKSWDRMLYTFTQQEKKWHRQARVLGTRLDTSTTARLESWQKVGRDFIDNPLLGTGTTGYAFVDGQYIKTLIESGVLGLAAFFTLLYQIFKRSYRIYRNAVTPYYKGIAMGFICAFIGMLTHALASNTFIIIRIMEPFCLLMGIVFMIPYLESLGKDQPSEQEL